MMELEKLIAYAVEEGASDMHFVPHLPLHIRVHKELKPVGEPLDPKSIQDMLVQILKPDAKGRLQKDRQVDFLHVSGNGVRLRGNAFFQDKGVSVCFRIIPKDILPMEKIGFPNFVYEKLMNLQHGLVLCVGATGQGKSTTLAAIMQERINQKTEHLITLEDPIEYLLASNNGIVQQRELGRDIVGFKQGIKGALREDPDMVMVGEMRDLETISSTLTIAETGHVAFATLHTNNGPQTITRIIDVFPADQQAQIRSQLAATLAMVISQRLIPRADGQGLVLAYEILTSNYAIKNYIRQNKIFQIPNVLQTDSSGEMIQFEQSLVGLVLANQITVEQAEKNAHDTEQLRSILAANGVQ